MPISVDKGGTVRVPFAAPEGATFRRPVSWTIYPDGVASVNSLGGDFREDVTVNAGARDGAALLSASALMAMAGGVEGVVRRFAMVVVGDPGGSMAELQAEPAGPPADQPEEKSAQAPTPTAPRPAAAPAQDVGTTGVPSTATVEGNP